MATILLGPLFAAENFSSLIDIDILLFGILFFFSITFACNINCYHDRDVDTLKKKDLARSIDSLGISTVKNVMVFESVIVFVLILYFFLNGYIGVALLASLGWAFGYLYSAPPIRLKNRGILGPIPVNLGVYVLPIFAGHLIIDPNPTMMFLLFVAGYALLNFGINLVNVAEDYEVDRRCEITTAAHKLGLKRTVGSASSTASIGSAVVLITLLPQVKDFYTTLVFLVALLAMIFTSADITSILLSDEVHEKAQKKGKRLPLYFTSTRYPMVLLLLLAIL
ncbi:MAG: UbiA family prenyltransferase [Candidatus Thermoplasmatota archaeon]|nr:UbiA family prenyltransferase [Candidatus Thermoplasmatota archaeon]